MNIPKEFDEIRPYSPEELPAVYDALLSDSGFMELVDRMFPSLSHEQFAALLRSCKTNQEVQEKIIYGVVQNIEKQHTDGVSLDTNALDPEKRYTFVSNHRDIVTDPTFLSKGLVDNHFPCTVEIAIGDNLLVYPWIKRLVRVLKAFIVQRSLHMREMLISSRRMSRYMHFAIAEKHENIWIAQRQGRAKDSDDRTQDSILKMMAMGGEGTPIERLIQLHIVPLSLSYEYDPCDYLKAMEFQLKRDDPHYVKTGANDLLNMQTGLTGYKGRVHFAAAPCMDEWLRKQEGMTDKNAFFEKAARHIDHEIFTHYRLYPCNYAAADMLRGGERFKAHYTEEEKKHFEEYLASRIALIDLPNKDEAFLRERILTMYANPALNKADAEEQDKNGTAE